MWSEWKMSARNPELELMRFVFCLLIVLHHADNFSNFHMDGWHAVGFFFILSGFFLPNFVNKRGKMIAAGLQTGRLLVRRWKKIYPYFVVSVAMGLAAWNLTGLVRGPWWWEIQHIWPELFCLQMFGSWPQAWWITGVSWFLSALFAGLACIFPIVCFFQKKISKWILTGIFIISCLVLIQQPEGFDKPGLLWLGPLHKGLLIAVAGLSFGGALGAWYYDCLSKLPCPRIGNFRWSFYLMAVIWMFCNGFALITWLLAGFGILFSVWYREKTPSKYLNKPWVYFCGEWSITLFLNHYYWALGLGKKFSFMTTEVKFELYFALSLLSSLLVWWLVRRLMPYLIQKIVNCVFKNKKRASV